MWADRVMARHEGSRGVGQIGRLEMALPREGDALLEEFPSRDGSRGCVYLYGGVLCGDYYGLIYGHNEAMQSTYRIMPTCIHMAY